MYLTQVPSLIAALCLGLGSSVRAELGTEYQPVSRDPLSEPWRCTSIEAFSEYTLNCVSESPDGVFWFGTDSGVISFDGFSIEKRFESDAAVDIEAFGPNDVYLLTISGLWRFDGEHLKLLRRTDLSEWEGNRITRSQDGTLWVGLREGLLRVEGDNVAIVNDATTAITSLTIDRKNRLWMVEAISWDVLVATIENGILAPRSEWITIKTNVHRRWAPSLLSLDAEGNVWIVNRNATPAIRYIDEQMIEHVVLNEMIQSAHYPIKSIAIFDRESIWLADSKTVYSIEDNKEVEQRWPDTHSDVANYEPKIVYKTSEGHLLVGGRSSPLLKTDIASERWMSFEGLNFQCEDNQRNRWYLSREGAAVKEILDTGKWVQYDADDGTIDTPVVALTTSNGFVWLAGSHDDSAAVSYFDGSEWKRNLHPELGSFISHLSAYENSSGEVLFGSGREYDIGDERTGGLVRYRETDTGKFEAEHAFGPNRHERIVNIVEDENDDLWFGGTSLSRIRKGTAQTISVPEISGALWTDHMLIDEQKTLWMAAWGAGVYRRTGEDWKLYTTVDGLCSNRVSAMLLDANGAVWAASDSGISRFDGRSWLRFALPPTLKFKREAGTLRRTSDGAIWVNVSAREWFFRGSRLHIPGEEMRRGFMTVKYQKETDSPETYINRYNENVLDTEYAHISWEGLDYWSNTPSDQLEFSYRLDGGRWSPFSPKSEASFNELDPGEHSVEVRARDRDGNIDATPASAGFTVVPVVWRQPWFIATSLAVFIVIASLIVMIVRTRIRHMVEIRDFKLWFFTQISHELRNPLSVILGPIESQLKRVKDEKSRKAMLIAKRNALKMLHLVNQLLEFQKVEVGNIEVSLVRTDIVDFVKDVLLTHTPLIEEKRQILKMSCLCGTCVAKVDSDKLQKILDNLISNAIKYTPEYGQIGLVLEVIESDAKAGETLLSVTVEDDGIGISKEQISKIYQPYYRGKSDRRATASGSGIGLALIYELVQICHGRIVVESPVFTRDNQPCGSRFRVMIPLVDTTYTASPRELIDLDYELKTPSGDDSFEEELVESEKTDLISILLVDDNPDVRSFIRGELEDEFQLIEAENGKQGLYLARKHSPDLVVSDVMMPEMDGREFCAALKSDRLTSHIPVFLLTAKTSEQSQLQGLEAGADEYLPKPINVDSLRIRIRNLFASRKALKERFNQQKILEPKEVAYSSLDEQFLAKAISLVEERIVDSQFSLEELAKGLNVSRMTLYRKFKSLIGKTPHGFITMIRMKRAAQLLEKEGITVLEVSDSVGFNDSNYFSRCFKKAFNCSPREYMAKHNRAGDPWQAD